MTRVVLVVTLLLTSTCDEWRATPAAAIRRVGGAKTESCIKTHGCFHKQWCLDQVERTYCADAGSPGCSENEPEGMCL